MTLTELQKQIFEINKANGWHDKVPSKLEQHALFHTEITEAYNEYIAGRLDTWYQLDGKPEGFYTELADVVIRILDYMSLEEFNYPDNYKQNHIVQLPENQTESILLCLHAFVSKATEEVRLNCLGIEYHELVITIGLIDLYLTSNNQSLADLITEKIAYNKTRGHRHGGKVI